MPQPKSSRPSSSTLSRTGAAKRPAAAKPAKPAARKPAAAKRATTKPAATRAAPKPAGTKRAAPKAAKPAAAAAPKRSASGPADPLVANLAALGDVLARGVLITAERIQETMDDAVKGGHLTRAHGQTLARDLIAAGRRQSDDVRQEIEGLLGRGRFAASQSGDRVLREVDRARRRVGVGPTFPISLYDDLTAAQVQSRLADLSKPEVRKVRDHEQRTAKRKSVLAAIERRLEA